MPKRALIKEATTQTVRKLFYPLQGALRVLKLMREVNDNCDVNGGSLGDWLGSSFIGMAV